MTFNGSVYPHHWVSHGVACRVAVSITRSAPIRLRQQHDHHSSHDDAASGCRTTSSILALHRLIFCAPRQADHVVGSNMLTTSPQQMWLDVAPPRAWTTNDVARARTTARAPGERETSCWHNKGGEAKLGPARKKPQNINALHAHMSKTARGMAPGGPPGSLGINFRTFELISGLF